MSHLNNAQWWAFNVCILQKGIWKSKAICEVQGNLVYHSEFWQETDGILQQGDWGDLNKGTIYKGEFRV